MAIIRGRGGRVTIPAHYVYSESETQLHPLGTALEIDERVFRYAKAGEAHVPGKVVQSEVPVADHTDLAVTTAAAGATQVTLTNGATTAFVANDHAEGFLWAVAGTCVGQTYKIKSHPAALVNATCVFTLYDELVELLTNAQETMAVAKNPYMDLIIHPGPPTARVVGVPPIDVQDNYYFWLQTWGPCSVFTESSTTALTVGENAEVDAGVAGAVSGSPGDTEMIVGVVMRAEGDTDYSLINLMLAP